MDQVSEQDIELAFQKHVAERESAERQLGLTVSDRVNLYAAGINTVRKINQDFPERLPDIVVLPDTSARVLKQLVMPSFVKMAKERGVNLPKFANMWVHFPVARALTQHLVTDNVFGMNFNYYVENADKFLPSEGLTRQMGMQARATNRGLALEILAGAGNKEAQVIAIDDAASFTASTCREVAIAFGTKVPFYTLLSQYTQEHYDKNEIPVFVGRVTDEPYFHFRKDKHAIGFFKDEFYPVEKYVFQSDSGDTERKLIKMFALRDDMHKIGVQIASDIALL